MREKTLKFLGLMRKARALEPGESSSGEAVCGGKGKLLLLASDASPNARKRAESYTAGRSCLLLELPFTKEELGGALGKGDCSLAAVTDLGFANALGKRLAELSPERYGETAEELARRFSKAVRRKGETAKERNKWNGKRRTNG